MLIDCFYLGVSRWYCWSWMVVWEGAFERCEEKMGGGRSLKGRWWLIRELLRRRGQNVVSSPNVIANLHTN
jgi:hypothetical protein